MRPRDAATLILVRMKGKTPEVTMSHRLTSAIKKNDKEVPITKIRPGVFALREWEEKKGKKGK